MGDTQTVQRIAYGVGMAFSASCFTALGMLVGHAGALSPWVLGASFALMLVIVAAVVELSALFPSAVGLRTYIRAGVGDTASLAAVLLYLSLVLLVGGLEVRVLAAVLAPLWPGLDPLLMTLVLFAIVIVTQLRGWRASALVQTALVALLLCTLAVLVIVNHLQPLPAVRELPAADLASATVIGLFLFASVEWITTLQVRHPADARSMPRVLLLACGLLMLLFLGTTQTIVRLVQGGVEVDPALPQQALAARLAGPWGPVLLLLVTGTALFSTFHAGLACAARLVYMLAREGHLPRVLTVSNAAGVPAAAVMAVAVACLLAAAAVLGLPSAAGIAEACALAICTVYVLYLISAARLRSGTRLPAWRIWRLPRAVLWTVALLLLAVMVVTCWESQQQGRLLLALMPWAFASIGLLALRARAAKPAAPRPHPPLERTP